MQNEGLNESQVGIKIARRNINNLTYADDITLMAEGEEELKSFFPFCPKCGIICISEVIDIYPSLAFYMMYSAYKLNKQGGNIQP